MSVMIDDETLLSRGLIPAFMSSSCFLESSVHPHFQFLFTIARDFHHVIPVDLRLIKRHYLVFGILQFIVEDPSTLLGESRQNNPVE